MTTITNSKQVFKIGSILFFLLLAIGCEKDRNIIGPDFLYRYNIYVGDFSVSQNIYVVDGATLTVRDSINVGGAVWHLVSDPVNQKLYAASTTGYLLHIVDIAAGNLVQTIEFTHSTDNIEISKNGDILFISSTSGNIRKFFVYNAVNLTPIDSLNLKVAEIRVAHSQEKAFLASLGSNKIYIYDYQQFTLTDSISLTFQNQNMGAPRFLAVTPDDKKLYATTTANRLIAIDLAKKQVIASHSIHVFTADIAITPDGKRLYVTDPGSFNSISSGNIGVYDVLSDQILGSISTEGAAQWKLGPDFIAITPDGNHAFVTPTANGFGGGPLLMLDLNKQKVVKSIQVGRFARNGTIPAGIAIVEKR